MKIFLDDIRNPLYNQRDYKVVRTFNDFKSKIDYLLEKQEEWLEELSLDYDLSLTDSKYNGVTCLNYLLLVCVTYGLTVPEIIIHSSWYKVELKFDPVVKIYQEKIDQQIQIQYKPRP